MSQTPDIVDRPQFPILGSNGAKIDWQLVADHGGQANKNHYQTVKRLAERGGLSWSELHAVLHNRPWQKMDDNTAIIECRALEAQYLNTDTIEALRFEAIDMQATIVRLTRELAEARAEGARAMQKAVEQVCKDQRECFASEEYATPQPISSLSERFACTEILAAIAILDPKQIARLEHRKELSHD